MIDVNKLQFGVEYTLKKGDKTFKGYLTKRTRPFNDVWLSGVSVSEGKKTGLTIEDANKYGWRIV